MPLCRVLWFSSINYLRNKKNHPFGPRQYDIRAQRANSPSLPPPVGAHTPSRRTSPGIVHCWEKLLAAWEPASAMEAGQLLAAGTLFKDAREAGLEAPTAGAEAVEPDGTAEGAAEWATAEPEEDDEYMQYVDWDCFETEQGEAVEQGGGEQGGEE
jgi:hypothetical protein